MAQVRLISLASIAHRRPPTRVLLLALTLAVAVTLFALSSTAAAIRYTFEDGSLQGWSKTGSVSAIANSADRAKAGTHSLKVTLAGTSYSAAGFVRANPGSTVGRGDTLEAYVYSPTSGPATAALYVQDQSYRQTAGGAVTLAAGWTRVTYTVPSTATLPLRLVGLQFGGSTASSATLYVDEVGTVGSSTLPVSTATPTKAATAAPTKTPVPGTTPTNTPTKVPTATNTPVTPPTSTPVPSGSVNPMIWGANFDWRIQSNPSLAASLHVRSVRIAGDNANYQTWLQTAKNQGWTPLIILRSFGVADRTQRIATNQDIVRKALAIWGTDQGLYFEFGNEADLNGWNAQTYTAEWNATMPQVIALAPRAKYGGPTNFQANPTYISYFVQNSNPKPNFISWHEYTCDSSWATSTCMANIANWKTHVLNTASAIKNLGFAVPPMAITEWNYAPDGNVASDPDASNYQFMYDWTKTALNTLTDPQVAQYVFMADHFNVSDNTPLFRGSTVTGQGQAYSDEYVQHVGK